MDTQWCLARIKDANVVYWNGHVTSAGFISFTQDRDKALTGSKEEMYERSSVQPMLMYWRVVPVKEKSCADGFRTRWWA